MPFISYLFKNALNGLLVQLAIDGVFTQARSDGAEVIQRCHPERHLCLLVTKLVHLDDGKTKKYRQGNFSLYSTFHTRGNFMCVTQQRAKILKKTFIK